MVNKLLYKSHRILGTILSILFLMWFLSGFVMIYHNFPKITDKQKYKGLATIETTQLSKLDSLVNSISHSNSIKNFLIKGSTEGGFQIEYKTNSHSYIINSEGEKLHRQSIEEIVAYANNLNPSRILKVDTVKYLDRWIPYIRVHADFPYYKFYYNDEHKSELYVSSLTGEGVQYTNADSRFWAWIGPIPHWLYIASLRNNTDLWRGVLIVLSGMGSLMSLVGIIIGFKSFYRRYRRKRELKSPYKSVYKLHHILGFIFGAFVFSFVFSGMMSLQKVPQWIIPTNNPQLAAMLNDTSLIIEPQEYSLNYADILKKYDGKIKKIEWFKYGKVPFYKAVINDSTYYFDARTSLINELSLSNNDVKNYLVNIYPKNEFNIELINDYDNYYINKKLSLPLPVYKVTIDDVDRSCYYINPKTAEIKYFNTNMRVRKWTYQALHSFSVKVILDRPVIWNILMWTSMIGGTLVSLTGVYLGIKYLKRKIRRIKK